MSEKQRQQSKRGRFFNFSLFSRSCFMTAFSLLIFFPLSIITMTLYILTSQQQAIAQQTTITTAPSQANVTTNNFLTYDNASLAFKIQYPSTWVKFEQQNTVLFISPSQNDSDRYRETVAVSFIPFNNNVSLDKWVSN